MKLDTLHLFIDVVRTGSFAQVALARGVSPSTVSRAIAELEAGLGTRLLHRTTRRMSPTEAGEHYATRLQSVLEDLQTVNAEVREQADTVRGRIRVACSVSFAECVVIPLLRQLRRDHPHLAIDLVTSDARTDLIAQRIDVAIRHGELSDTSLVARRLTDVRYRAVAAPDYLRKHGTPVVPYDIRNHTVLTFDYPNFRNAWTFVRSEESETVAITPTLTAPNAGVLRQCALQGHGIAVLADWTTQEDVTAGRLVEVVTRWSIRVADQPSRIWWVMPSRSYIPAKVRAFMEPVDAWFAQTIPARGQT